jgi:amino acid transporter
MTPEERENERLKLMANWFNTLATAIITAGTFIPVAQFIFAILPPGTNSNLVYGVGFICLGSGFFLHYVGQRLLEGLE